MDLPISVEELATLRVHFRTFAHDGRCAFGCKACGVVFIVSPAALPGENLAGLLAHGKTCHGPGPQQGLLPGELRLGR